MTLGLNEKEAEEQIIQGFLKWNKKGVWTQKLTLLIHKWGHSSYKV